MSQAMFTGRRGLAAAGALLVAGVAAGAILGGSLTAGAATPTPVPGTSSSSGTTTPDATGTTGQATVPGVQENDGIPESQEHHGRGAGLDLSGTVTAVGANSVTIKDSSGTSKTYTVISTSDIDKNGEAQLSDLVAGDAVTYSVESGTTTIDKLHAGDEAKDRPAGTPPAGGTGTAGYTGGSGYTT